MQHHRRACIKGACAAACPPPFRPTHTHTNTCTPWPDRRWWKRWRSRARPRPRARPRRRQSPSCWWGGRGWEQRGGHHPRSLLTSSTCRPGPCPALPSHGHQPAAAPKRQHKRTRARATWLHGHAHAYAHARAGTAHVVMPGRTPHRLLLVIMLLTSSRHFACRTWLTLPGRAWTRWGAAGADGR